MDSTSSCCHSSEQSWRAGTAAAAPGTGVGGKLKRRGMRKPGCSFFASASSSALLAQTFPVPQELLQQQLPNPLDESNFRDLFLPVPGRDRQDLEESSEENCSPKQRHRALENPSIQLLATINKHRAAAPQQSGLQRLLPGFQPAWIHGGAGRQPCAFLWSQHQQVQP